MLCTVYNSGKVTMSMSAKPPTDKKNKKESREWNLRNNLRQNFVNQLYLSQSFLPSFLVISLSFCRNFGKNSKNGNPKKRGNLNPDSFTQRIQGYLFVLLSISYTYYLYYHSFIYHKILIIYCREQFGIRRVKYFR